MPPPAGGGQKRKAEGGGTDGVVSKPDAQQLFSGCRMSFWAQHHTRIMQQRVQQLGGQIDSALTAGTTHMVCPKDMTAQQAADKLKVPCERLHASLPQDVAFVTLEWVGSSIQKKQLQPTEAFQPAFLTAPPPAPPAPSQLRAAAGAGGGGAAASEAAAVGSGGGPQQSQQQASAQQAAGVQQPPGHQAEQQPASSVVTRALNEQERAAAEQQDVLQPPAPTGGREEAEAAGKQLLPRPQHVHCKVERRGSEFVAVVGARPQYTGGLTGIPWGSYGVWDEPYDPEAATRTVERVKAYWFRMHEDEQQAPATVPQPPGAPAPGERNSVCSHAACSRRPYCLLEKLSEVKRVYLEGRGVDQFKIRAIDGAVQKLSKWSEPLDTAEDVDRVGLGAKSADKVTDILAHGSSARVQAAQQDEQLQVLNLFMQVWGVGAATASRWYSAGLRTLDDLRQRDDLTEYQWVGLRYFDDLALKIPRAEVARAEALARDTCFGVAEQLGAWQDVERTYCFATGSYRRGKPESSDIDILTCLPPSLAHVEPADFLTQLLRALLARGLLLDELNPTHRHPSSHTHSHASWMGLCRPPGSPHVRRIDVKVYAHECTPFAVNYFANSQSFCRATRFWANHAVPEVAQRYNPAATGFKISDSDLQPIHRKTRAGVSGRSSGRRGGRKGRSSDSEEDVPAGPSHSGATAGTAAAAASAAAGAGAGDGGGTQVLGPAVPCPDESSIFRLLGLSYVPVHMRYFRDFF